MAPTKRSRKTEVSRETGGVTAVVNTVRGVEGDPAAAMPKAPINAKPVPTSADVEEDAGNPSPEMAAAIEKVASEHHFEMEQVPPSAKEVSTDGVSISSAQEGIRLSDDRTQMIPFELCYRADNVRTEENVKAKLPQMISSIRRNGFKRNHPLVVSKKTDGRYLVLCGNRRTEGLEVILASNKEEFDKICPDGKVPAIVYENLTPDQEIVMRIDHSPEEDRLPLDEWETCLAVFQLVKAGHRNRMDVAEKLGQVVTRPNGTIEARGSWAQPRINLARLPRYVQELFRDWMLAKKARKADTPPLKWTDVAELYKTYSAEFSKHPEGRGPLMQELISKITDPGRKTTPKARPMSATKVTEEAKLYSSPELQATMLIVAGVYEGEATLDQIDVELQKKDIAMKTLNEIMNHLGEEGFKSLMDEIEAANQEAAEAMKAADAK